MSIRSCSGGAEGVEAIAIQERDRMNVHKNARLTPIGRERMVDLARRGQTPAASAMTVGVCPRTVRKWLARYEQEGVAGLNDRSSRPHHLYRPTPQRVVDRITALRRQRLTGQAIAATVGVSRATVSRVLRRLEPPQAQRPRTHRTDPPLRAREARRTPPHRHQEARPIHSDRPSCHARPHRPQQDARQRLGVRARRHRRCLPHRLHPDQTR